MPVPTALQSTTVEIIGEDGSIHTDTKGRKFMQVILPGSARKMSHVVSGYSSED